MRADDAANPVLIHQSSERPDLVADAPPCPRGWRASPLPMAAEVHGWAGSNRFTFKTDRADPRAALAGKTPGWVPRKVVRRGADACDHALSRTMESARPAFDSDSECSTDNGRPFGRRATSMGPSPCMIDLVNAPPTVGSRVPAAPAAWPHSNRRAAWAGPACRPSKSWATSSRARRHC